MKAAGRLVRKPLHRPGNGSRQLQDSERGNKNSFIGVK